MILVVFFPTLVILWWAHLSSLQGKWMLVVLWDFSTASCLGVIWWWDPGGTQLLCDQWGKCFITMMSVCCCCRGWSGTRPTGGSLRSLSCAKEFPWADLLHRYLQCYLHPGFMGPSHYCLLLSLFIAWAKGALSFHPPDSKTFTYSVFRQPS